jgi:hypothetical protein
MKDGGETTEEKMAFLKKHGVVIETPVCSDPNNTRFTWP